MLENTGSLFSHLLDDGGAIVQDRESCRIKALTVRGRDLYNAGFVVNEEKSV